MKSVVLALLCFVTLVSCTPNRAPFQFYVVIKPDETAMFIGAITAIAKDDGLETAAGQARSDTGHILRVVEGRGHGLNLWVQSASLSGREDPTLCGVHHEPYPDPAQFIVFTEPRFFGFKSHAAATELGEKIFSQLQKLGFDVRRVPAVCGTAVFHKD
jgi:hypothetical protein